jgi:oligopeptide transport system substrate-binding protein
MEIKKMRLLLTTLLSLNLLFHGCTKSDSTNELSYINQDGKKVFAISRSSDPRSLDPQKQFDETSSTFTRAVYDNLISYHYLKRPYTLIPELLEKIPEFSSDGLSLHLTLKKGVFFHDDPCFKNGKGKQLTTDDIIYSIKRFANIKVNTQSWFLLDEVVVGLDELREKSKKFSSGIINYSNYPVPGLKKIDNYNMTIKLKKKNPLILYSFAASSMAIIAKEAVEKYGQDFSRHPVGTGAFKLKSYSKKQTMVLTKNKNYFMNYPESGEEQDKEKGLLDDAKKQLPLVDEVHIHYIPESQPTMLKFKREKLAWVALDRDNYSQMAHMDNSGKSSLKKDYSDKFTLYEEPGLSIKYLVINLRNKLLGQNKHLRKAIAYALDVKKQIKLLNNGRGYKLYSMVPPSIYGSQKHVGHFGYDHSEEKALEHLKLAGYPKGTGLPIIEVTLPGSSTGQRQYFEFLRNSLANVGIIIKPDYKTWPSFLKATERGDFQISSSGWAADYPDAENFYQLLYGPNQPPGQNSSYFDNPRFNELYEKIRFMQNSSKRNEYIKEMAQIVQSEVPIIFESTPVASGLIQKWVKNFKRNIMISKPFRYLNVEDPSKKKALTKNTTKRF